MFGLRFVNMQIQAQIAPISKNDQEMLQLQKKVKSGSKDSDVYLKLGWIFYQKGAKEEAKRTYIKGFNLDKDHEGILYNLGLIFMEEKDYSRAEVYLERVVEKNKENDSASLALARAYVKNEKYPQAEQLLISLKDKFKANADYFYLFGLVCEKFNRLEVANSYYNVALKFDPEFKEAKDAQKRLKNLTRKSE